MYLAQNLKCLRERNGEMQKDIADFLSVSKPTAGRYESGECEPNMEKLIALANHFGVTIDDWLRKNMQPQKPKCADNLKFYREKYELTQEDIGKLVGVGQKEVSKYEKDDRGIPLPKLLILSEYFGVTLDQFVKQNLSKEVFE